MYQSFRKDLEICEAILRKGSRSFAAASKLLPKKTREASAVVYAFCRIADDTADEEQSLEALGKIEIRLHDIYYGTDHAHPVDRALSAVVREYDLPKPIFDALLEGMQWDLEGRRYQNIEGVHAYSARVASTVGMLMTLIMGVRDPRLLRHACELGLAMQLTNIARDVGEDARKGRIYLPLNWFEDAGIDAKTWQQAPYFNEHVASLVARMLQEAKVFYQRADPAIEELPKDCRLAIRAARNIYADIGQQLSRLGFNSVEHRAYTKASRKLFLVFKSLRNNTKTTAAPEKATSAINFLIEALN